jgi:hypothetical protein
MRIPNIEEIAFYKLPNSLKVWEEVIRARSALAIWRLMTKAWHPLDPLR